MKNVKTLWLALALSALVSLLAACGADTAATSVMRSVPSGETLYVMDGVGATARIVAFHPAAARPAVLVTLPAGLTTQDHRRLYAAQAQGGQTTVAVYDAGTGAALRSFTIAGTFGTAGSSLGYPDATLAPDGHWLALRAQRSVQETTLALVDTQAGTLAQTMHLAGDFSLDAMAADGTMLYLLQNLHDAEHHYYVRAYDVTDHQLLDANVVDKSELNDPLMQGYALTRQTVSNGSVDYTLYVDPARNIAFIHALPLASGGPNAPLFAHCINLPVGRSGDLLRYYTLAMNADETMLYAANAALGIVSAVSVEGSNVFNDSVAQQRTFDPGGAGAASVDQGYALYGGAALARDGTLYVAGTHGVWALDGRDLHVKGSYLTQEVFTGLGLSADDRVLYAVDPTQGIMVLNLATGEAASLADSPALAPQGIAWIAG